MVHGQVITNNFQSQEDLHIMLGEHDIHFERTDDPLDLAPHDIITSISTNTSGMRVKLNQYNNSTFEFYDNVGDRTIMKVQSDRLDMNNNRITTVANPTSAQDAVNRQYCQLFQVPIGCILPFYGTQIPPYYLLCNGASFNQAIYPDLYAFLGNSNVLPDLRGCFLRGLDPTNIHDPDVRTIGSLQLDSIKSHQHSYSYSTATSTTGWAAIQTDGPALQNQINANSSTGSTGNSETRPVNVAVSFIIMAKKIITYGEI